MPAASIKNAVLSMSSQRRFYSIFYDDISTVGMCINIFLLSHYYLTRTFLQASSGVVREPPKKTAIR